MIGIDIDGKCLAKGKVSVGEVRRPMVRGLSANSPKIGS